MTVRRSAFVVSIAILATLMPRAASAVAVPPGACASHVSSDFDGDGAADLAVGVPGQTVEGRNAAGAVHVIYGDDPDGLDKGEPDHVIDQATSGVNDGPAAGDRFGSCLASGDFNGDGEADLAIGVPGENIGRNTDAGAVSVLYGSVDGLSAHGPPTDDFIHQNSRGIVGASEDDDRLGSALAAGDFDGDGRDDLAIGVPFEDITDIVDGGAINVVYGRAGGLTSTGSQLIFQDTRRVEDRSETFDEFGASLAAGSIDNDGRADLAVGVPGESIGSVRRAGAVHVFYSSPSGVSAEEDILWHQDRSGVLDQAERNDRFGTSVAIGDFDSDGFADLATGIVGENTAANDTGAVAVLYANGAGLNASGDLFFDQDDTLGGAAGNPAEIEDRFGTSLAAADFNGDAADDLAIGVPEEDTGAGGDAGVTEVVYGGDPAGLVPGDASTDQFSQDTVGIGGDGEEAGDRFGAALSAGDFNGDGDFDLAMGAPDEDVGAVGNAGSVNVVYGTAGGLDVAGPPAAQFFTQDAGGIADDAEPNDRFGGALG